MGYKLRGLYPNRGAEGRGLRGSLIRRQGSCYLGMVWLGGGGRAAAGEHRSRTGSERSRTGATHSRRCTPPRQIPRLSTASPPGLSTALPPLSTSSHCSSHSPIQQSPPRLSFRLRLTLCLHPPRTPLQIPKRLRASGSVQPRLAGGPAGPVPSLIRWAADAGSQYGSGDSPGLSSTIATL